MKLPKNTNDFGQIRTGSAFGDTLTSLAMRPDVNVIVETGTWRGLGSTYCLFLGMTRPEQHLWTMEMCLEQHEEAKGWYEGDPRITFIHGSLVLPEEVPPFTYPDPDFKKYYDKEVGINKTVPYVLDQIPEKIDLLLIDGGAWSGEVEFAKLYPRSKIVALDDTNPRVESKNVNTRIKLLNDGWKIIADRMNDRNGWAAFERP